MNILNILDIINFSYISFLINIATFFIFLNVFIQLNNRITTESFLLNCEEWFKENGFMEIEKKRRCK